MEMWSLPLTNHHTECEEYEKLWESGVHDRPKPGMVPAKYQIIVAIFEITPQVPIPLQNIIRGIGGGVELHD